MPADVLPLFRPDILAPAVAAVRPSEHTVLARRLREDPRTCELPILALSAYEAGAGTENFSAYLRKPASLAALREALADAVVPIRAG